MPVNENSNTASSLTNSEVTSELEQAESGLLALYDRIPRTFKVVVFGGVTLTLAVLLTIFRRTAFHWFEVHTGIVNTGGPYYGFWSGFGSDLGEATLLAGALTMWRHHSCHVRGCAHLGRTVEGTPYLACPKHHPAHRGAKRGISLESLLHAHEHAKTRGE